MKNLKWLIILLVIITIFNFTINFIGLKFSDILSQSIPKSDKVKGKSLPEYFVTKKSYFEKQEKNQCAGFSSAYVLRCLKKDVKGKENYNNLKHKFSNGYVMPQALVEVFKKYKYNSDIYKGDLNTLKLRLAKNNNPIVVLIGHRWNWQHYVTVIGYDEKNIYIYDSNNNTDNSKGYNRIISNEEFVDLWENEIPFFEKIYFVVDK